MRVSILALMGAVALSACGDQTPEKDQPNPGTAEQAASAPGSAAAPNGNQALIDATPQVSLTEEQRAELREIAKGFIDRAAEDNTRGFTAVAGVEDEVVALQPSQTHAWTVRLQQGQTYRVIGGCDYECADMDFELLDPSGKIVERDTLPDAFPIINIAPPSTGAYVVRFVMKTCTVAPCYAAGRLYRQTGSTREPDAPATTT